MEHVLNSATSLNELAGERIEELRKRVGLTQAELGSQVAAVVGGGWSRQVVWQVEQGRRALTAADLLALAKVFSVPPSDIVGSHEPVSLGGAEPVRTDVLMSATSESAAADGWARFEIAREALHDVRAAWARYVYEMDVVRTRVAASPALRERIDAYLLEAIQAARAQVAESNAADAEHARVLGKPAPRFDVTPTPAIRAAEEALNDVTLPDHLWRLGRRRPEAQQ